VTAPPSWEQLPDRVARMLVLDRVLLGVFALWAVVSWGYLVVALAAGWDTPRDWRVMVLAAGLVWAPYEVVWWARKVRVVARMRRDGVPLRAATTRGSSGLRIDGGPAQPRAYRPLRQLLRLGRVEPWAFRLREPGESPRLYRYTRATRSLLAGTWLYVPELWVAEDETRTWLVVLEPDGRYVKVCRRSPWHEADPGRVRWWTGQDDVPPLLARGQDRRRRG
jgi:hypothetical protein